MVLWSINTRQRAQTADSSCILFFIFRAEECGSLLDCRQVIKGNDPFLPVWEPCHCVGMAQRRGLPAWPVGVFQLRGLPTLFTCAAGTVLQAPHREQGGTGVSRAAARSALLQTCLQSLSPPGKDSKSDHAGQMDVSCLALVLGDDTS